MYLGVVVALIEIIALVEGNNPSSISLNQERLTHVELRFRRRR